MPYSACRVAAFLCLGAAVVAAGCANGVREDDPDGHVVARDTGARDSHIDAYAADTGDKPDAGLDAAFDGGPICVDMDGDGFGMGCAGGPDCDDSNASASPTGTEVCNGVDDDCDSHTDEGLDTPVFCGVGACRTSVAQCAGGHTSTCTPLMMGTEVCNGIDDDCDDMTDEGFGAMTCGVGACRMTVAACSGGTPPACMPGTPTTELCNGVDDDCNGTVDDNIATVFCGMGACRRSVPGCTAGVPGACVPGTPVAESCNGLDDNCDGVVDDGFGAISCGVGACHVTVQSCVGGNPMSCTAGTGHPETCNSIDDDCNGAVDDSLGMTSCGVGACLATVQNCISGVPQTCHPGTPAPSEICTDSIDNNCNGQINEGCVTCTPPGNTTCASAAAYSIGATVMGDNTCSANDVGSSCGNGGTGFDTAYSFTSTGSPTRYTVTMPGATSPTLYDTVLHAHVSTACNASDEIACNDDTPIGTLNVSTITIDSPPSGSVYLVADGFAAATGSTYTLTSSSSALNNDLCANAIPIRANGVYTGNTTGLADNTSPLTNNPSCASVSTSPDVYYTIQARASGNITLSLCGTSFDTILYVGTSCSNFSVACDDDNGPSCSGVQSSLTFAATSGTTYYIAVDGWNTNSGPYTLTVSGY